MKHFILAFVLAAVLYVLGFVILEQRRSSKGPWEVTFAQEAGSAPTLTIRQPALSLSNFCILLPGSAASALRINETVRFDQPRPVPYPVPFGRCVFMDLTSLPGSVTLELAGHQVEMLPRSLIIDGREHAWTSDQAILIESNPATP